MSRLPQLPAAGSFVPKDDGSSTTSSPPPPSRSASSSSSASSVSFRSSGHDDDDDAEEEEKEYVHAAWRARAAAARRAAGPAACVKQPLSPMPCKRPLGTSAAHTTSLQRRANAADKTTNNISVAAVFRLPMDALLTVVAYLSMHDLMVHVRLACTRFRDILDPASRAAFWYRRWCGEMGLTEWTVRLAGHVDPLLRQFAVVAAVHGGLPFAAGVLTLRSGSSGDANEAWVSPTASLFDAQSAPLPSLVTELGDPSLGDEVQRAAWYYAARRQSVSSRSFVTDAKLDYRLPSPGSDDDETAAAAAPAPQPPPVAAEGPAVPSLSPLEAFREDHVGAMARCYTVPARVRIESLRGLVQMGGGPVGGGGTGCVASPTQRGDRRRPPPLPGAPHHRHVDPAMALLQRAEADEAEGAAQRLLAFGADAVSSLRQPEEVPDTFFFPVWPAFDRVEAERWTTLSAAATACADEGAAAAAGPVQPPATSAETPPTMAPLPFGGPYHARHLALYTFLLAHSTVSEVRIHRQSRGHDTKNAIVSRIVSPSGRTIELRFFVMYFEGSYPRMYSRLGYRASTFPVDDLIQLSRDSPEQIKEIFTVGYGRVEVDVHPRVLRDALNDVAVQLDVSGLPLPLLWNALVFASGCAWAMPAPAALGIRQWYRMTLVDAAQRVLAPPVGSSVPK